MSDFSDRPLVAGSLIGLRSFAVDNLGRLYGPSYNQVFRPGENEAECRKGTTDNGGWMVGGGGIKWQFAPMTYYFDPAPIFADYPKLSEPVTKEDTIATVRPPLTGRPAPKPRGYGTLRSLPSADPAPLDTAVDITPFVEDETREMTPEPPPHVLAGVDCTCGFYAYFDGANDYKKPERLSVLIEGYGVCTVGSRGFRSQKARAVAFVAGKKFPAHQMQLVLRNYPDVPVYATKDEALEAHPLTPPDLPGPDSPDFWDRPVRP